MTKAGPRIQVKILLAAALLKTNQQPEEMARILFVALCLVVAASAVQDCYFCKSGASAGWQNPGCPANGNITGWAAQNLLECESPCATVVKRWPEGDVVRACSVIFNFQLEAIPTSGCEWVGENYVCFCEGDACNNQDVSGVVVA